jgi:hypothetical protein
MEAFMNQARALCCLAAGAWLMLAGCSNSGPAGNPSGVTGRQKGIQDAERDVQNGVLKLKEYPPLPYSLTEIKYIKLLQERCAVGHEVQTATGNEPELRAEVEAYNSVMTAEIKKKFGADILAKLRQEAGGP